MSNQTPTSIADDLLTGARPIAEFLGWPLRRVYYAAEKHYLPIGRLGAILVARRSELSKAISGATSRTEAA